eukprot:scaffold72015_cov20-Tisochrysis_lutea.AAC.3
MGVSSSTDQAPAACVKRRAQMRSWRSAHKPCAASMHEALEECAQILVRLAERASEVAQEKLDAENRVSTYQHEGKMLGVPASAFHAPDAEAAAPEGPS